ncbi:MAG TPA: hypothetical protein VKA21_14410, partial [Candidatus Binatia bacterium]|nr:hypothetical protein [Candidatus Binatia bacterium]
WALGIERIVGLLQASGAGAAEAAPAIYLVLSGERAELAGLALAERLRTRCRAPASSRTWTAAVSRRS